MILIIVILHFLLALGCRPLLALVHTATPSYIKLNVHTSGIAQLVKLAFNRT